MNTPQLSITVALISRARVQHGGIITDQQIAFLPFKAKTHSVIICDTINNLHQTWILILNRHIASGEF